MIAETLSASSVRSGDPWLTRLGCIAKMALLEGIENTS